MKPYFIFVESSAVQWLTMTQSELQPLGTVNVQKYVDTSVQPGKAMVVDWLGQ